MGGATPDPSSEVVESLAAEKRSPGAEGRVAVLLERFRRLWSSFRSLPRLGDERKPSFTREQG